MEGHDENPGTPVPDTAGPVPAALWRRLTAVAYDSILLTALFFVVTVIVVASHRAAVESGAVWFRLLLFGCGWLYFAWCWVHGGQTVGMRAWKIRVVGAAGVGSAVTWSAATLRYLAAFVPALPLATTLAGIGTRIAGGLALSAYLAAFAASRLRRDRACWHDLWSGTRLCHWK